MSEKTEQPTAKRLRDSRKKGDVAYSKDFTQTVLILSIFGYLLASSSATVERLGQMILLPGTLLRINFQEAADTLVYELLMSAVWVVLPFIGIVLGVGILADTLQVGILFAFEKLKPSGKKLNMLANAKNIFSKKNLVEFLKSCLKISFLSVLLMLLIRDAMPILTSIPQAGLAGLGMIMALLLKNMLLSIGLAYSIIALADFVWQRHHYRKNLMMTKHEVKQEHKQMEGDPQIKHKRKQMHKAMQNSNAVQQSRKATALVTNPTHLAVALLYEENETPLPLILAMGESPLAEQMMAAAREAGVPIMQNIPLARALVAQGEAGQYIPSELIEPVAELLRLLLELNHQPPQ